MNAKMLGTIALVAAAFAIFVGVWGLVAPGDMQSPAEMKESIRWAAAGILGAGISGICSALAARKRHPAG